MKSMMIDDIKYLNDDEFIALTDTGEEVLCNILFSFDNEDTGKSYIAYTDNTFAADGSINAYAAVYHPEDLAKGLESIESEAEWSVIDTILSTIQEEVQKARAFWKV